MLALALILAAAAPVHTPCDPATLTAIHDSIMAFCPCDTAVTHTQFTSCSRRVQLDALKAGSLSRDCRRLARRGSARSSCGRPGAVTCCRSGVPATATCTVKRGTAACIAVGGCPGATSTCLDACASACGSPSGAFLAPAAPLF